MATKIMNKPTTCVEQMRAWALSKGATEFAKLAEPCYKASLKTGVDPAVSYALSARETGWCYKNGHSTAGIDASYHNPAGLKISKGGSDYDKNAHARFKDWEEGYMAQQQHLALYAGADGYPLKNPIDTRHFDWLFGKAKTTIELGGKGKWNNNPEYGVNIENHVQDLYSTSFTKKEEEKPQIKEEFHIPKIVVYNTDIDCLSAVILAQKLKCALISKENYENSKIRAKEVVYVGGQEKDKNRFETFKNVAKLL